MKRNVHVYLIESRMVVRGMGGGKGMNTGSGIGSRHGFGHGQGVTVNRGNLGAEVIGMGKETGVNPGQKSGNFSKSKP